MQPSATPTLTSWQEFIYYALVAVLTGGGTWFVTWFRRHQSKADTAKTEAETRQIDLNTTLHAGDMLLEMIKQAATASANVERLRAQKEFWQNKAETLETERDLLQLQLDERIRIGKVD